MPLPGSGLWGSPGGGDSVVGVLFAELAMAAYRIAGITKWARVGPSDDMYAEALPAYNRMVGLWNCERPKCFTIRLDTLTLPTSKVCTIGSGGDFDMPRPLGIRQGVVVLADGARLPEMANLTDDAWASIAMQDVAGAIPYAFYYDGSYDPLTGLGRVYLYPQASSGLSVDWYTWSQLATVTSKDDQIALPLGYEEAVTYGLAVRLASLNPLIANMPEESRRLARKALAVLEAHNTQPPAMTPDYPIRARERTDWYRTGGW